MACAWLGRLLTSQECLTGLELLQAPIKDGLCQASATPAWAANSAPAIRDMKAECDSQRLLRVQYWVAAPA